MDAPHRTIGSENHCLPQFRSGASSDLRFVSVTHEFEGDGRIRLKLGQQMGMVSLWKGLTPKAGFYELSMRVSNEADIVGLAGSFARPELFRLPASAVERERSILLRLEPTAADVVLAFPRGGDSSLVLNSMQLRRIEDAQIDSWIRQRESEFAGTPQLQSAKAWSASLHGNAATEVGDAGEAIKHSRESEDALVPLLAEATSWVTEGEEMQQMMLASVLSGLAARQSKNIIRRLTYSQSAETESSTSDAVGTRELLLRGMQTLQQEQAPLVRWSLLAAAAAIDGQIEPARDALTISKTLAGKLGPQIRRAAWLGPEALMALAYAISGDESSALKVLNRCLDAVPVDWEAQLDQATAFSSIGRLALQEGVRWQPADRRLFFWLQRLRLREGLFADVAAAMDAARISIPGWDSSLEKALLEIDFVLAAGSSQPVDENRLNTAQAACRKILKGDPDDSEVARKLTALLTLQRQQQHAWLPLQEIEATCQSTAQMQLQADGSLLVSGDLPRTDAYVLTGSVTDAVSAIRLEAMTHGSLVDNGPGRDAFGDFCLTGLRVFAGHDGRDMEEISIVDAAADVGEIESLFDEDPMSGWSSWPRVGENHVAFMQLAKTIPAHSRMRIELKFAARKSHSLLGCFRISGSNHSQAVPAAQTDCLIQQFDNTWTRLAAVWALRENEESMAGFDELAELLARHPVAAIGVGEVLALQEKWDEAISTYTSALGSGSTETDVAAELYRKRAEAHASLQEPEAAEADLLSWAERFRTEWKDPRQRIQDLLARGKYRQAIQCFHLVDQAMGSEHFLRFQQGCLLGWLGREEELRRLCTGVVEDGKTDWDDPYVVERTTKICLLIGGEICESETLATAAHVRKPAGMGCLL